MAILKDFKCDNCGKEFEVRINPNATNPVCPDCGNNTHWLPKLNSNPPQISYQLRVLCNGFNNNIHMPVE